MPKILHRDISLNNLMFRKEDGNVYAVLNNLDLAIDVDVQSLSSKHHTGTKPFMAIDLLSRDWWHICTSTISNRSSTVMISDLALFKFLFTIWRGFWGVTYVADTCLLTICPGGSHMTPPVSYWLDHITTHRWLPPSMLLWLSTRRLYVYSSIILLRYISQACWVASSPRLDFFCCTTVLW